MHLNEFALHIVGFLIEVDIESSCISNEFREKVEKEETMLGRVSINLTHKQLKFQEVYQTTDGASRQPDYFKLENLGLKFGEQFFFLSTSNFIAKFNFTFSFRTLIERFEWSDLSDSRLCSAF